MAEPGQIPQSRQGGRAHCESAGTVTAPAEISKFTPRLCRSGGGELSSRGLSRQDFEKAAKSENDPDAALSAIVLKGPGDCFRHGAEYFDDTRSAEVFLGHRAGCAPERRRAHCPNFYAGQLYWKGVARCRGVDGSMTSTSPGPPQLQHHQQLQPDPRCSPTASGLPHVRSFDIVQYLQQGSNGLINLEADYTWSPYPDWYHRVSLGIFEEMYGGVANVELLYRPAAGRSWAVAFDINRALKNSAVSTRCSTSCRTP